MAYTDTDKAMAIEIVRRNGGVLDAITLSAIRSTIGPGVSAPTIRGWLKHAGVASNPQNLPRPSRENLPQEKRLSYTDPALTEKVNLALDRKLEQAAHKFVDHAMKIETIQDAKLQQAMTAAAIAIDKMQLLRGLPTEIIAVLPDLLDTIRRKGYDPAQALMTMKTQFSALPDKLMVTESHGAN